MIELPDGLHGAHRRTELHAHLGHKQLKRVIAEGRLVSYCRTVVIQRERMADLRTRAAAALLMAGPDAVLSNHTAAWLHGCTAASTHRVHLTIDYGRKLRLRSGLDVHHQSFHPDDVVEVDGLRCLTLAHAVTELLCRAPRGTALACADQALAQVTADERAGFKADLAERITTRADHRGRRQGMSLLDLATGLPESPPESALLLLIADAGFPLPEPQHSVRDLEGREVWRLDFAWPHARLGLEYDGHAAHADRRERDAARDDDLRRRGWRVLRADASDLRNPITLFNHLHAALGGPQRRSRGFWV
ncbi:endonuclease domain-containing protein [Saccharothrix sp. Mg75]|uniref:endonuclease domain-containing protein n=1 Tax=Saccharothrix sp. Mg75 TaxID=3445357 RepID=UPI003EEDE7E4